jgi:hypothetical protein
MGPEFGLQRATATNGQMVPDPAMSVDGELAPRPGDPLRTLTLEGVIGRPDTIAEYSWATGQRILDRFNA